MQILKVSIVFFAFYTAVPAFWIHRTSFQASPMVSVEKQVPAAVMCPVTAALDWNTSMPENPNES
jgi:hypothetical protein